MFEAERHAVSEAEQKLTTGVMAEYPIGAQVRFEWIRQQLILGRVVKHFKGAVQVLLLEDAKLGTERKGNELWIQPEYIKEKL